MTTLPKLSSEEENEVIWPCGKVGVGATEIEGYEQGQK